MNRSIARWIWVLGANSPEEKLNSNLASRFTCFRQEFYFENKKNILAKSLQVLLNFGNFDETKLKIVVQIR